MVIRANGRETGSHVESAYAQRDQIRSTGSESAETFDSAVYGVRDDVQRPGHLYSGSNNMMVVAQKDVMVARGSFLGASSITTTVSEQVTPRQLPLENSWKRAMKR